MHNHQGVELLARAHWEGPSWVPQGAGVPQAEAGGQGQQYLCST